MVLRGKKYCAGAEVDWKESSCCDSGDARFVVAGEAGIANGGNDKVKETCFSVGCRERETFGGVVALAIGTAFGNLSVGGNDDSFSVYNYLLRHTFAVSGYVFLLRPFVCVWSYGDDDDRILCRRDDGACAWTVFPFL